MRRFVTCVLAAALLSLLAACDQAVPSTVEGVQPDPASEPLAVEDLALGDVDPGDIKADGWGAATVCKPIPDLPRLTAPEIVISLAGATLHLVDHATGFERVYPLGVGALEQGVSLTPTSAGAAGGVFTARFDDTPVVESASPVQKWGWTYSCRVWWKDVETGGKLLPVFAGLPFIRLEGPNPAAYGIHGPIDHYTLPSGGKLRRGHVSHGCIRMEAADLVDLFARARGLRVPVRIQAAPERRADGRLVEVADPWIGGACQSDADCTFEGGACRANAYTGQGFCTRACTKTCPDRWGYPTTFCVDDPEDDAKGICVAKATVQNAACDAYPGMRVDPGEPRHGQPSVKADVCVPGAPGWIGDPCWSDVDCLLSAGTCALDGAAEGKPGVCTQACDRYCPDLVGQAGTFCVDGPAGAGTCAARCTLDDDCPAGRTCVPDVPRHGQPGVRRAVCL